MLLSNLNLLATAPGGVVRLRELILTLAVQGKLMPQDSNDEPASELLKKIRTEKDRLIAEGKIKRDKPLVEIAEEEQPFGLPKGWEWARLGDLCSYIQRGKGPAYADHSEHRVISQKCVRWYGLNLEPARFVTAESLTKYEAIRFLQAGDLLWNSTGTGTIGRACLVPPAQDKAGLVADSHVTVVRPVQLNGWFLWRWIQSPYVQSEIEGSASGTTNQIELNTSTVINHLTPVPPAAEQSRIVNRVEELMRLCDALEAKGQLEATQHAQLVSTLLATLTDSETSAQLADNWHRIATHFDLLLDRPEAVDALEQTIFGLAMRGMLVAQDLSDEPTKEVVTRIAERRKQTRMKSVVGDSGEADTGLFSLPQSWAWCNVEQIAKVCLGGTPARQESSYWNGTIPWVSSGEVANGRVSDTKEKITPAGLANSNAKVYPRNTVLIAMIGQGKTRGQSAILDIEASTNQNVAGLILEPEAANPNFIFLWALHEYVRTRSGGRGGAQPALNGAIVRSLKVPLPPLAEQARIITRVAQLRRLCADLRQRLAASQSTQAHLAEALVENVA